MLSIKSARIGLVFLVLTGIAGAWGAERANADPTISIQPPLVVVTLGQTTSFSVSVDDSGDPISCFIVQIHYDPTMIEVTDVVEGILYSSVNPTLPDHQFIDPDTLQISNCILGSGTFILGPGSMADIEILGIDTGTSPIEFAFAQVRDIERIPYGNPGIEHGEVIVTEFTGVEGDPNAPRTGSGVQLRITPNPAPGWARIEILGASAGSGVTAGPLHGGVVDIYDIAGRLQRSLQGRGAGDARLEWDGRDIDGRPLPAGLYMARVRGVADASAKLLLVR